MNKKIRAPASPPTPLRGEWYDLRHRGTWLSFFIFNLPSSCGLVAFFPSVNAATIPTHESQWGWMRALRPAPHRMSANINCRIGRWVVFAWGRMHFQLFGNRTHRKTVGAAAAVLLSVVAARSKVEVVGAVRVRRVLRGGPVLAPAAGVVEVISPAEARRG